MPKYRIRRRRNGAPSVPRKLTQLVRKWQVRFGLQNWHIVITTIEKGPGGDKTDHTVAQITSALGYQNAKIIFCLHCFREEANLERFISHELLHLLFAPVTDFIEAELNVDKGEVYKRFAASIETALDGLANIFVRTYSRRKGEK